MAAVPTDPWSAGFMALGSIAKQEPVSSGASNRSTAVFDNSGFAVSIGGGTVATSKTDAPTVPQSVGHVVNGVAGLLSSPVTVIVVGLALFLYLKHK
ncbi:hypothetical protein [Duganella radicis]|uniref:Uncharacterized protein n=1 Tax=Duganella radicis TaxID=551988 RepID=A0A6L6PC94_9BURK|nr:hypothetical protein [Duganella radicis]MTV36279.1 hypothetical protein [Duganella radicis]